MHFLDILSLTIGWTLGALVIWAFMTASSKANQSKGKYGSAKKAKEESAEKAKKAKEDQKAGFAAKMESLYLYLLGTFIFTIFTAILFGIIG